MPKIFQYALIASIILIIAVIYAFAYRQSLWCILNLFLRPKAFIALTVEDIMKRECSTNMGFKERCEKDEKWKVEQIERFKKQFSESTQKLRNRIYFAFVIVLLTLLCALGIAYIAAGLIFLSSNTLLFIQLASAFLILWAIIGQMGYPIQTIAGESIPENIDKFWFIFLNIIGIFSLLFTQFYSFFKK